MVDVVTSPLAPAAVQQWQDGQMHALEGVRLPFAWKIALFLVIGGAWVFLSTHLEQVATGRWHAEDFREGTVEVLICVAILLYLRALKRSSVKALVELRPVVPVPEEQYERLA